MTGCNAKFLTLEHTDEVVANLTYGDVAGSWIEVFMGGHIPDGATVARKGDRLMRVEVTVVTCDGEHMSFRADDGSEWTEHTATDEHGFYRRWYTPGATPHRDPESYGSYNEYLQSVGKGPCPNCGGKGKVLRGFFDVPCPSCEGSGNTVPIDDKTCPTCNGSGHGCDAGGCVHCDPCPDCRNGCAQPLTHDPYCAKGRGCCPSCGGSGTAPTEPKKENETWNSEELPTGRGADGKSQQSGSTASRIQPVKVSDADPAPTDSEGTVKTAPTVTDEMLRAYCVTTGVTFDNVPPGSMDNLRRALSAALQAAPAPIVTDAEVEAAQAVAVAQDGHVTNMRDVLEAAARARKEQE